MLYHHSEPSEYVKVVMCLHFDYDFTIYCRVYIYILPCIFDYNDNTYEL